MECALGHQIQHAAFPMRETQMSEFWLGTIQSPVGRLSDKLTPVLVVILGVPARMRVGGHTHNCINF